MRIGILEPSDFSPRAIEMLSGIGEVTCLCDSSDMDRFISDKEVLFIRLAHRINDAFLASASSLRVVCTPTTGLNHIDVDACRDKGIKIISLQHEQEFLATIRATPEHTFGLVLALLRNYAAVLRINKPSACNRELYKGEEIYGNHVGIIGFGRIGKCLAQYFSAFGAAYIGFYDTNTDIKDMYGAARVDSLEALINASQIIVLCASYSASSHKMINRELIDSMKGHYFINTARGELIDEPYLLQKIQTGHFKGVALDVIANESDRCNLDPIFDISPVFNFIYTPHIGGATCTSMLRTEEQITARLLEQYAS